MKRTVPFDYNDSSYWENDLYDQKIVQPQQQKYQETGSFKNSSIIDPVKYKTILEFKKNFNKNIKQNNENSNETLYSINNNLHVINKKYDEEANDFVSTDIGSGTVISDHLLKRGDSSDDHSLVKRAFSYFQSNIPSVTKETESQINSDHKKENANSRSNSSDQSKISPKSLDCSQYNIAKKYDNFNCNSNKIEDSSPKIIKRKQNGIIAQNYEYPLMPKNTRDHMIDISDISRKNKPLKNNCNLEEIYSVGSYNLQNKLSLTKTDSDSKILAQIEHDLETQNSLSESLPNQSSTNTPFEKTNKITIDHKFPKNPFSLSCNKNDYQYNKNKNRPVENLSQKTRNIIKNSENNKSDILFIENLNIGPNNKEIEQISLKESLAAVEIKSPESVSVSAMKILNGNRNFMLPNFLEILLKKFEELDLLLSLQKSKITPPQFSELKQMYESSNAKTLNSDDILMMLRIYPGCYNIEWAKNAQEDKLEIKQSFPSDENASLSSKNWGSFLSKSELNSRKTQMRNHIFCVIKYMHDQFQSKLQPPVYNYDYSTQSYWHHIFDIEKITEEDLPHTTEFLNRQFDSSKFVSPNKEISYNKRSESKSSVKSILTCTPLNLNIQLPNYNQVQEKKLLRKTQPQNNQGKIVTNCNYSDSLEIVETNDQFTPDSESVCSNDKELNEVYNMCNFACNESTIDQQSLADCLVGYFNKRNVSNMFYSSVLCYLSKQFTDKEQEIDYRIKSWVERDSRWLRIVKDGDLIYLRVNKHFDYSRMLRKK